jgi:hypothetical protein
MTLAGIIGAIILLVGSTKPTEPVLVGHLVLAMLGYAIGSSFWAMLLDIAGTVRRRWQS